MATIVDKTACELAAAGAEDGLLPVNPFNALQFHFGMLLGVDDLETGQAYPRGKVRLHNAWLHREGVVWGLNVSFNSRNELAVDPGLALDAAGHELHLDRQACMDVGLWYSAHKDDPGFTFTDSGGGKKVERARGREVQSVPDEARAGDGRTAAQARRPIPRTRECSRPSSCCCGPVCHSPRTAAITVCGCCSKLKLTAHRMQTSKRGGTRSRPCRLCSSPPHICGRCGSSRRSMRSI